ncbi:hypothetical protein Cni_G13254 [Canna indica]|uniref:Uncharacterized protein n=1 Tax=Canna indica TaxID=4628 RepID=A0AAQ3K978_9LILI|nr:hypothetical protein Cni_G13254 [Canna indica]
MAVREAASSISRLSAAAPAARLILHLPLIAGGGDHHGPPKVNFWEDPLSPSKWKEGHFVLISLTGWGLIIYGGFKLFSENKEKEGEKSGH